MRTRTHSPLALLTLASAFWLGCGKKDKDNEGPPPAPPAGDGGNPMTAFQRGQSAPATQGLRRFADAQTIKNDLHQLAEMIQADGTPRSPGNFEGLQASLKGAPQILNRHK